MLEDRRVRSARDVAAILGVPVGEQHDEDLQTVQFARADERVVVPGPAVLLEHLTDLRIIELEARILKAALIVDAGFGSLQIAWRHHDALSHEIRGLREVPAAPDQPYREAL